MDHKSPFSRALNIMSQARLDAKRKRYEHLVFLAENSGSEDERRNFNHQADLVFGEIEQLDKIWKQKYGGNR